MRNIVVPPFGIMLNTRLARELNGTVRLSPFFVFSKTTHFSWTCGHVSVSISLRRMAVSKANIITQGM